MTAFTEQLHTVISQFHLAADSTALFAKVFKGDPNALTVTGGKPMARWQAVGSENAPEGARNLRGDRMFDARFNVSCYWPLTAVEGAGESQEDAIAETMVGLPAEIVAITPNTYTLADLLVAVVTVETVTVQRAFLHQTSEFEYRTLSFDVHARVLEAA